MGEPSIHDGRLSIEGGKPWLGLQPIPERRVSGEVTLFPSKTDDTGSKAYFTIDYLKIGEEATVEISMAERPSEQLRLWWKNEGASAAYLRVLLGYQGPEDKLPETHTEASYIYHIAAANSASPGTGSGNALQQWPTATLTIQTGAADGTVFFRPHTHHAADWEPVKANWANGIVTIDTARGLNLGMYVIGKLATQATTQPQWANTPGSPDTEVLPAHI